jgi:hypothetical protein
MGLHGQAASTSGDQSGPQLTVELRDGSRVVGQSLKESLSFHSSTVGDIKLPWTDIRAIEYPDDTKAAHLTATNGDALTVQLSSATLVLQTGFGQTELPVKLIRSIKVSPPPKSNIYDGTGVRLTIALRDGSRLVGTGLDDTLNFHSAAMGDLKLTWAGVRSIVYSTLNGHTAQLTAANGDVYEVQFMAPTVRVETGFGESNIPVKLIRSIKTSTEGDVDEHLIGWWKLDDGSGTVAADSSPGDSPHDGALINGPVWTQDPDRNQMGLRFNGANQYVSLGNILQGGYAEFSIACWVKHVKSSFQILVERHLWDQSDGIAMILTNDSNGSVLFGHYMNNWVQSRAAVQDGQWHHIVGTISKGSGGTGCVYTLYVDGKLDNTTTLSEGFTAPSSGLDWTIGARDDGTWAYDGMIGDVRIYDRALSAKEVEAIYAEKSDEKASPTEQGISSSAPSTDAASSK